MDVTKVVVLVEVRKVVGALRETILDMQFQRLEVQMMKQEGIGKVFMTHSPNDSNPPI